ncbi:RING-H2 finger protein ATL51-like [Olea europaea var. sylvestris]|uniref:RING-H2 finger protein ATL51-like n=1 Tax=Olea europaea var. sylvestris TaxID=158386 RepID=UPI000C1CF413|nr:RING-H2 finger protein ATL51-like [Olea europaea var. sylvestris]
MDKDLSTTTTLLPLTSKLPFIHTKNFSNLFPLLSLPLALRGGRWFVSVINQKKSHLSILSTRSLNCQIEINSSLVFFDLELPLTLRSRQVQLVRSLPTLPPYSRTNNSLQILLRVQILDMGSVGNQNLSTPYDNSKECSQGNCSINCPRWCYFNFPPPPLDDDSGTHFSPLIIAIIAILAVGFLVVSYYMIVKRYCRRRNDPNTSIETQEILDGLTRDQMAGASTGLDEALIKTITVFKYKKGDGLIDGAECVVCLNEFQENESLRLMPNCMHGFHLPCIDPWLKSHPSCPICRVDVNLTYPLPPPARNSQTPSTVNVASLEIQRPDDLILVVDDHERDRSEEVVPSVVDNDVRPKSPLRNVSTAQDSETRIDIIGTPEKDVKKFSRSISPGAFSSQRQR